MKRAWSGLHCRSYAPFMVGSADDSGHTLSPDELASAIGFLGYGNPAGAFWFVGIEERGVGKPDTLWQELQVRARHFGAIEDLKAAQEHPAFGSSFQVGQYVPTWLIMSKIVLRLTGDAGWSEYARAQQYQAERLGRRDGESFLADLLPLPAGSVGDWPYPELFATKDVYRQKVLPRRIAALRQLVDQHSPVYVFCYGKGYWDDFRQLFPEVTDYEDVGDGFAKVGRTSKGTLVSLTPFFSSYALGHARIDQLAVRLRQDRFTWYDDDVELLIDAPQSRRAESSQ